MMDIEAKSEFCAIAIYESVHDDESTRTPWASLSPGEWEKWRRAANKVLQAAVVQSNSNIAQAAIEAVFAERNYPCNPGAAARAGFEAANRMMAAPDFVPGSSKELNAIHAVVMSIGSDWPEVDSDPYTLWHVKRMARELKELRTALPDNLNSATRPKN